MGTQARGHNVKSLIVKRQIFDIALASLDISQPAFGGEAFDLLKHLRREIEGDDLRAVGGDVHRRVTRAAARVQDVGSGILPNQFGDGRQIFPGGVYRVADLELARFGYGAMQLAGPGVFGPPKDRDEAVAVLRAAVELGINHIDTADFYGPHVTNEIIREALAPYPGA